MSENWSHTIVIKRLENLSRFCVPDINDAGMCSTSYKPSLSQVRNRKGEVCASIDCVLICTRYSQSIKRVGIHSTAEIRDEDAAAVW